MAGKEDEQKHAFNRGPSQPQPQCPECGSRRLYRDGLRYLADGSNVQRWLCRDCSYRFSEKPLNSSDKSQHTQKIQRQILNSPDALTINCQGSSEATGGAPTGQPKLVQTLAEVEPRTEKRAAGATKPQEDKGATINFAWKLKKEAYSEATIKEYCYILQTLLKRGADLYNPESVKETIAMQETWSNARKSIAVKAYSAFLKTQGLKWNPPKYKVPQKLPFIPLEKEIDDLIAGCNLQMAAFLQVLKETGARCGEAFNLKWTDVDLTNNTLRVTAEKGSNPRIFKISSKLASMLANLPKKSVRVFTYKNKFYLRKSFDKQRKRIAYKLGNPRLLRISFHTFRHWKATMEYYKTKDILHVMQLLGHKNIKNTLIYTQLVKNISDDEYVCKATRTLEEAKQLIEAGFEYVCEMESYKLFRKRK